MPNKSQELLLEQIQREKMLWTDSATTTTTQAQYRTQATPESPLQSLLKYNPNHDPHTGEFTSSHGGTSAGQEHHDSLDVSEDSEKGYRMFHDGLKKPSWGDPVEDSENAKIAKKKVVEDLSKRLRDNPDFKDFASKIDKAFFKDDGHYRDFYDNPVDNTVNKLVKSWSVSSSGTYPVALAMQRAAADLFGLSKQETSRLEDSIKEKIDSGAISGTKLDKLNTLSNEPWARQGFKAFLQAMYDNTQEELKKHGIKEITLYRGFSAPEKLGFSNKIKETDAQMNPMSAYAFNPEITRGFAGWGDAGQASVIVTKVKAEDIMGSAKTGFGCLAETEMIVIGRQRKAWGTHIGRDFSSIKQEIEDLKSKRKKSLKQAVAQDARLLSYAP